MSVLIQSLGIPRSFSYSAIAMRGLRTTTPPMSKKTALRFGFGGMTQSRELALGPKLGGWYLGGPRMTVRRIAGVVSKRCQRIRQILRPCHSMNRGSQFDLVQSY